MKFSEVLEIKNGKNQKQVENPNGKYPIYGSGGIMANKVKLKNISTVITKGTTPTSLGFDFVVDGINFVKIESINDDGTFVLEKFAHINSECNEKLKRSQLQENDILFSIAGAIGRTAIVTKDILPANTNQALAIIRIPKGKINYRFLLYALHSNSIMQQYDKQKQGVAQLNLSLQNISDFEIPLFSDEVQNKIVYVLSKVDDLIADRTKQLKHLENLVKSRFIEMFGEPQDNPKGYEKRQLKETCKVITGNTPSRAVSEYYGEHIEWIKTDNIVSGLINPTTAVESLSEKGLEVSRTVEKDSILMACIAGSVSSIGRVCITDRKVAFNQQINAIVPNDYNIRFLYVLLQISKEHLVEGINMALKGILSKSKLEEKVFIVPPKELQDQFATFVEQTDKLKFEVKQSLEKLEMLKKALMQEYFG
ncbi:MAG: restriction endonuclease subunit S [Clostridia bacterium]|nr:restriction endonuclease subunit S [Clostridia bacterium]